MNFTENLLRLRKEKGLSQEQLAEKLDVSRQSVYKWESGQSYPELEKLQQMSQLFNCTIDELVNGTVTKKDLSLDRATVDKEYKVFGLGIGGGVFTAITGLSILLYLSDIISDWGIGIVVFFIFAIISVSLFIYHGMRFDEFEKEYKKIGSSEFYSSEERKAFIRRFSLFIILAISIIILSVIMIIILYGVYDIDAQWPIGLMFNLISIGVFILIYHGIEEEKFEMKIKTDKKNNALTSKISSIIMLVATIIYILLGFIWNLWHPGWLVFVVGGISCGIVNIIFEEKD